MNSILVNTVVIMLPGCHILAAMVNYACNEAIFALQTLVKVMTLLYNKKRSRLL